MKELSLIPLEITGNIPSWLSGTLVRNGPIRVTIDGKTQTHWFDGLAMLHAFSFQNGGVLYSNRFLRTEAYDAVFKDRSLDYLGFACDPCRSLFKRFLTLFFPSDHALHNANINVTKIADEYAALNEIPLPVKFDLKTLDTLSVVNYQDQLPKSDCWESAHPHRTQRESINYLIEYGYHSYYVIYRIREGSTSREVIARIPVDKPAYMHSFGLTDNYIVLTEFPFVVNPLKMIVSGKPFITNYSWQPERGTQFIVIDRHSGRVVKKLKTKPFFAFHHVNAFEEGDQIKLDIVCYPDAEIISGLAQHWKEPRNIENQFDISLVRYSLGDNGITSEMLLNQKLEFPRINSFYDGKPYRFVYMADPREAMNQNDERVICKFDVKNKNSLTWSQKHCYPGEPVFVPSPNSKSEDDGVVMVVVLDEFNRNSFLLIKDGKSFDEIARAIVPHAIPAGLHGQYFYSSSH